MEDMKVIKLAASIVLLAIVVPIVGNAICHTGVGCYNAIQKVKHKAKIKKGLKNGSIIEIDGKYYDVEVEEA
jgi:hypothetical protein